MSRIRWVLALAGWMALLSPCGKTWAQTLTPLQTGDCYQIQTRSTLSGDWLAPDPVTGKTVVVATEGSASDSYQERVLHVDDKSRVDQVVRVYKYVDYQRKLGEQLESATLRDKVGRIVIQRQGIRSIPYSPDGPLEWPEIVLVATQTFVPALQELAAAPQWTPGTTWQAPADAVLELTGLDAIDSGGLQCVYKQEIEHEGNKLRQIAISGSVTGTSPEGKSRHQLHGAVYVDVATQRFRSLRAVGDWQLLAPDGKVVGKLRVDYQLRLDPVAPPASLADASPDAFGPPSPEQLAVLYDNPALGIRMVYPRGWLLTRAEPSGRITFDLVGNSLAVQCEKDDQTPTAESYHREVTSFLANQKVPFTDRVAPRRVDGVGDHFQIAATLKEKATLLDYWLVREGRRGATLAARLDPRQEADLTEQVRRFAQGIRFTTPTLPPPPKPAVTPAPQPQAVPAPNTPKEK